MNQAIKDDRPDGLGVCNNIKRLNQKKERLSLDETGDKPEEVEG